MMDPRYWLFLFLLGIGSSAGLQADSAREGIHPDAQSVQPLLPGMPAPPFEVRDVTGKAFRYDPESMTAPLVLTFYRGGWCPYCNLHLSELRTAEGQLRGLGFDIWFISIDRPEVLEESLDQPDLGYILLSDARLSATRAFGLAFRVADATVDNYLEKGIDLEAASGEDHHALPAPSTFIIGEDGIIRFQYTNPDYTVRLHPEVLLAAARAYADGADERLRRQRQQRQTQR